MKGKGCLLTEFIRGSICHEANAVALVQIFPEASYFLPPVFLPAFLASLSLSRLLYLSLKCQPRVETLNSNVSIPRMMIHVEQRKIKEHHYFVYKVDHKYRIRTNIQCYYFSVHAFFFLFFLNVFVISGNTEISRFFLGVTSRDRIENQRDSSG